jgi:hypothetical protein
MVLDLNKEMAWVTFLNEGWETTWHPVTDNNGNHLHFDETIMDLCRSRFNNIDNWISFGIAPTSQMILRNAVRDNL